MIYCFIKPLDQLIVSIRPGHIEGALDIRCLDLSGLGYFLSALGGFDCSARSQAKWGELDHQKWWAIAGASW